MHHFLDVFGLSDGECSFRTVAGDLNAHEVARFSESLNVEGFGEVRPEVFIERAAGGGAGVEADDVINVYGELDSCAIDTFPIDVWLD